MMKHIRENHGRRVQYSWTWILLPPVFANISTHFVLPSSLAFTIWSHEWPGQQVRVRSTVMQQTSRKSNRSVWQSANLHTCEMHQTIWIWIQSHARNTYGEKTYDSLPICTSVRCTPDNLNPKLCKKYRKYLRKYLQKYLTEILTRKNLWPPAHMWDAQDNLNLKLITVESNIFLRNTELWNIGVKFNCYIFLCILMQIFTRYQKLMYHIESLNFATLALLYYAGQSYILKCLSGCC